MKIINTKLDYTNTLGGNNVYLFTSNAIIKHDGCLVMGAGTAKAVRDTFSGIDKMFGEVLGAGRVPVLLLPYKDRVIGCFQVKHHYKEEADLNLVRASTLCLTKEAIRSPHITYHLNFPAVGCGKRSVDEVLPLLEGLPDNVHVYLHVKRAVPKLEVCDIDFN